MICIFCTAQTCSCSGTVAIVQDGGQLKPLSRAAVNIGISSSWQTEIELRRRQTVSAASAPQRFWRVSAKKNSRSQPASHLNYKLIHTATPDTTQTATALYCRVWRVVWTGH